MQPAAAAQRAAAPESSPPRGYFERGREIYNNRCYFCHGYSGDAKTLASTYLSPPPRAFTKNPLARHKMIDAVRHGRPGTAMMGFGHLLSEDEMAVVVDYVRKAFMEGEGQPSYYHSKENGWPNHQRYATAFPFALGEIPLDRPWRKLSPQQQAGKRLFMSGCITCHDRGDAGQEAPIWDPRAVSYPRGLYSHRPEDIDAVSAATPYRQHDIPPQASGLTATERKGEALFQDNCAFCHAADGTGSNWIGHFLQPHPRDLTQIVNEGANTRAHLAQVVRAGIPGTTMSAWGAVLSVEQIDAVVAYIVAVLAAKPEAGSQDHANNEDR